MSDEKFIHPFYDKEDLILFDKLESRCFLGEIKTIALEEVGEFSKVHNPSDEYGHFLHEAAIIEHEGVLYASWYTCPEMELEGYTPIIGRRSYDGGKTWTEPEIIAEDRSGAILYCPPVYGVCDGKLYMLMNQMVAPDHIHSLDLLVLNKQTDKFELLWSRPIPFKLNTNVVRLPNGKLMLTGRVGELDKFPNTPAVMISDDGKIDSEWRIVFVAKNGDLPDGNALIHPETTVVCHEKTLYLFNRNDKRRVPLVYTSNDYGENWSKLIAHDIPYISSKIYAGELSDGRHYLIANIDRFDRVRLVTYVSEPNEMKFTKKITLIDCDKTATDVKRCHYPAAVESDGKLYIIATAEYPGPERFYRGAVLFTLDLDKI